MSSDADRTLERGRTLRQRILSGPSLIGLLVAIAFVWFLATRFNVDWGDTWDNVLSMDPWLYAAGLAVYYFSFAFRAVRWRILARNAGDHAAPGARLPPAFQCARLLVIGWFINAIAFLRLGDAFRAYAFSEDSGGGISWSLGTVLAERVFDMAAVFVLLMAAAFTFSATTDSNAASYILLAATLLLAGLAGLVIAMRLFGSQFARLLPPRLQRMYRDFQHGTLGSFKRMPTVFALGMAGWALEVGRLYFVVIALGLEMELPLLIIASLGHAILSTAPIPGGVGVVEPGLTGLLILDLDRSDAVSVALVDRSITYLSVIAFGGIAFVWRHFERRETADWEPVRAASEQPERSKAHRGEPRPSGGLSRPPARRPGSRAGRRAWRARFRPRTAR